MSAAPLQLDPFQQAAADSQRAITTFLPSLAPKPPAPPLKAPPQVSPQIKEGIRAMSLVRHVEQASRRVARGLPAQPPPPPSPQETFPPELDQVHIRALQTAIAAHPETARAPLIHEAVQNVTKWIMAKNGQIVHDGHVEIAGSPEAAEKLAAKIINEAVDSHDQREQAKKDALLQSGGPAQPSRPSGSESGQQNSKTDTHAGTASGDRGNTTPVGNSQGNRPIIPAPPDTSAVPAASLPADRNGGSGDIGIGGVDPESGRTVTQSSNDLDEAQEQATAAAPELKDTLGQVADSVPGAEVDGVRESKDPDRAQQKADVDEKPVHTQTDLLAGRIAVDSPESKDAVVESIKNSAPVIDEEDNFQQGDPDYGFRSHTLQVGSGDGKTSAEVQVVPKEIADVDDKTHDTYEEGRQAEAEGDDKTAQAAMDKNKSAHDAAMDKFNQRNGDRSSRIVDSLKGAGFKVQGKPVKIGGHLFVPVVDDDGENG